MRFTCLLSFFLLPIPALLLAAEESPANSTGFPPTADWGPEMDVTSIEDPEVAKILSRFYESGLGGKEAWDALKSVKIKGSVAYTGQDTPLRFVALKRKPNLFKISVLMPNGLAVVQGFDGKVAWEALPDRQPERLSGGIAADLIRETAFFSYLTYPSMPGKTIEYKGLKTVADKGSHVLSVTLPDGSEIDYYLDAYNYFIWRQVTRSSSNAGEGTTVVYSDFRSVNGVPIAFKSVTYGGDRLLSTGIVEGIAPNVGASSWIFGMPDSPLPGLTPDFDISAEEFEGFKLQPLDWDKL